jgi:hypothetical protein
MRDVVLDVRNCRDSGWLGDEQQILCMLAIV